MKKTFPLLTLFLIALCSGVKAQNVNFTVSGNWSLNVLTTDITEAGRNYSGTYTSNQSQVQISHNIGWWPSRYRWTVQVHKEDVAWNNNIEVWTMRSGNGTGNFCLFGSASITGGNNYQLITNHTTGFFQGTCSYTNIPIQFQLRNVSVLTPAGNHSTTIVYSITVTSY